MSTRSILGLIYMVQGLQQLGHDPEPILQRHGLSMAQLDPTTRMERSRELRIYADISDSVQDPLIGLKLGGFYGLAGYGPLVMLLMTCATAYEALQVGVKYQRLTYLYGTLRLEPGEHMSALILDPMTMGHKAFRFRVDGEVAGTFKLVKVVENLRATIERLGGEIRFQSRVERLVLEDGRVRGVQLAGGEELRTGQVVLAIGHSARSPPRPARMWSPLAPPVAHRLTEGQRP